MGGESQRVGHAGSKRLDRATGSLEDTLRKQARNRLLEWYRREGRRLPWRPPLGPWEAWVAEIMLQQTRVETVVRYYQRFLQRFPDPCALAEAPLEEALALWSGLGYYRRCRLLWKGARQVASKGRFPVDVATWKQIPGVGSYTAAALASICSGIPVAVVDGNTRRVAARLGALETPVDRGRGREVVVELLEALIDPERPGDSNQALMDLGATICTPRRPACARCPLLALCRARALGSPEQFPIRKVRSPIQDTRETAFLICRRGRFLLLRRPESSELLAGLWELPTVPGRVQDAQEAAKQLYGLKLRAQERLIEVRHAITTRRIRLDVVRADLQGSLEAVRESDWAAGWFTAEEAERLALTGATRKALTRPELMVLSGQASCQPKE